MSMTVDDLDNMRHYFRPCDQCGAYSRDHHVIHVSKTAAGNYKVNRQHHWWASGGRDDDKGLWWATTGSSGARYFPFLEKALRYARRMQGTVRPSREVMAEMADGLLED
jgi:hypothetical protein